MQDALLTMDFQKIYPDDAIAFLADSLAQLNAVNPSPENERALYYLQKALYVMDAHAVKRHGYSGNDAERALTLPEDYNNE